MYTLINGRCERAAFLTIFSRKGSVAVYHPDRAPHIILSNHERSRWDEGAWLKLYSLYDCSTGSDEATLAERHVAAQDGSRRDMAVRSNDAAMVNAGPRIDQRVLPDRGARLDNDTRHDLDGALIMYPGRWSNDR